MGWLDAETTVYRTRNAPGILASGISHHQNIPDCGHPSLGPARGRRLSGEETDRAPHASRASCAVRTCHRKVARGLWLSPFLTCDSDSIPSRKDAVAESTGIHDNKVEHPFRPPLADCAWERGSEKSAGRRKRNASSAQAPLQKAVKPEPIDSEQKTASHARNLPCAGIVDGRATFHSESQRTPEPSERPQFVVGTTA